MMDRVALSGAPGSPYTRKMLGVLRYRRIPYRLLHLGSPEIAELPTPKVRLLPTFYLPGPAGELEAVVDSSPLIRQLERDWTGRSVIPGHPAIRFLDALIEDYADEWLTKAMFHYRWVYSPDIEKAARQLPLWSGLAIDDLRLAQAAAAISERQIGRLHVVGSNAVTAQVIEASYVRFLRAFEAHLTTQPFVLGTRPAACDFAIYGQLTQLAQFDPTPMALTFEIAPRVYAWTSLLDDLSGIEPDEGDWIDADAVPLTLLALLTAIGRSYVPFMLANAEAIAAGSDTIEAIIDGERWTQPPFPYQAKCLGLLREAHDELSSEARSKVTAALAGTGCEALFNA